MMLRTIVTLISSCEAKVGAFVLVSGLMLTGCTGTTYSSHFDCPMGEGANCASISRVNKLIDRQEIDLGNDDAPLRQPCSTPTCTSQLSSQLPGKQVYVYYGPGQLGRLLSPGELTARAGEGK